MSNSIIQLEDCSIKDFYKILMKFCLYTKKYLYSDISKTFYLFIIILLYNNF